jgi:hypothetical protein
MESLMSTILTMIRLGPGQTLRIPLSCGHWLLRTTDEIRRQQLYEGLSVPCEYCMRAAYQGKAARA